jgi:hypothetical protein
MGVFFKINKVYALIVHLFEQKYVTSQWIIV